VVKKVSPTVTPGTSSVCGLDLHRAQITFDAVEVESGHARATVVRTHFAATYVELPAGR